MELSEINPFPRTTGRFEDWCFENEYPCIAYDLRMFAFLKSSALVALNEKRMLLPADSLLILAPGEPYDFRSAVREHPFDLYCLSFDLTQEYRGSSHFRLPTYAPLFRAEFLVDQKIRTGLRDLSNLSLPRIVRDAPDLADKVRLVWQLFEEKPVYYLERCSGIIKELLFSALPESAAADTEEAPGAVHARRAMRYIEEHFREPISEKSVAAALNFHPYYLARLTKRYFSVTPYQYLIQCRIGEAVRLLLHTDQPLGAIASACGFAGLSHFSTVMRRKTGLTPGEIRKNGHI